MITKGDIIVSKLKIYYDGIHVVRDFAASQEMDYLGQWIILNLLL